MTAEPPATGPSDTSSVRASLDALFERLVRPAPADGTDRHLDRAAIEATLLLVVVFAGVWPVWRQLGRSLDTATAPAALVAVASLWVLRRWGRVVAMRVLGASVTWHWLAVALLTGGTHSPGLLLIGFGGALPALMRDIPGLLGHVGVSFVAWLFVVGAERAGWTGPPPTGGDWWLLLGVATGSASLAVTVLGAQMASHAHRTGVALAKAHAELARGRDRAAASSEAKSDFLMSMSHEIRTPMNGILGVAGLLLETELDRRQRELVETIRDSSNALVELVEDLLDFSRIESGHLRIEAVPFEPVAIVRQVADLLRVRAREKGLRLEVEVGPKVPGRVVGDGGRVRQILFNLVGNAVKFTHAGTLTVRLSCPERTATDALLRLEVEDTGIGIPREDLGRVFDRFTQLGEAAPDRAGGTGLGLSITRHVVELMGGTMEVDSEVGVGSTFRVHLRLPVSDAGAPSTEALPTLPAARILLAEDNPVNRKVALAMLDHLGCVGDTADNGEVAVRMGTSHPYDLVLMDLEMPGIDGIEATRRLRALGYAGPIVAMTGHVLPEVRRRCEDVGINDFVEKPVRVEALHQVLARWLVGA